MLIKVFFIVRVEGFGYGEKKNPLRVGYVASRVRKAVGVGCLTL